MLMAMVLALFKIIYTASSNESQSLIFNHYQATGNNATNIPMRILETSHIPNESNP